jgi:hypothetical protein
MKIRHILLLGTVLCSPNTFINPTFAQTTTFTYQGQLSAGGTPANGNYDLRFALYDAVTNGNAIGFPQNNAAVAVSNGLFAVALDFGSIFTGTNYWLDISVCPTGETNFTELFPRQPILPAPYAIFANSASNLLGNLSATQLPAGVVTNGASNVNISGTFSGDGVGVTNLNGANLQPGTVPGSAIGSIEATQVNGLGTAATNDATSFVVSTNGTAAGLSINAPGNNNNLLTLWATNDSPALYMNGDYKNGVSGDRYRAYFAGHDPGFFDNGYVVLDGEPDIYSIPSASQSILDIGQDVPHSIVTFSYSVANNVFESYVKNPFDNSITNTTSFTNGYQVFGIMGDGRLDSWNLWGWHDLNPRIVLLENDYTGNSAFAIDIRANKLILGATTFSNVVSYAVSDTGQEQNYQTNVTPGIIISANGYVGIAQTNPLAVPSQALDVNGNVIASGAIAAANGFESFATNMAAIGASGWTNNFGVNAMVYINGTAGQAVMIYDGSARTLFTDKFGNGTLPLELHPGWFFSGHNLNGTAVAE